MVKKIITKKKDVKKIVKTIPKKKITKKISKKKPVNKENPIAVEIKMPELSERDRDLEEFFIFKRKTRIFKDGQCPFVPGRKATYDKKYCQEMIDFFTEVKQDLAIIREYYKPDYRLRGEDLSMLPTGEKAGAVKKIVPRELVPVFPTFQRFCTNIGIVRETLYTRIKEYPELSDTYIYCKEMQHAILLEGTMLGVYKDNFSQFLLKNDFQYKDESEVKVKGDIQTSTKEEHERTEEEIMAELVAIQQQKKNIEKKGEAL